MKKLDKVQLDEIKTRAESVLDMKQSSTKVVAWYAHTNEIRGPFCRWFTVSENKEEVEKGNLVHHSDDVAYAATVMNEAPKMAEDIKLLLDEIERLNEQAKQGTMLAAQAHLMMMNKNELAEKRIEGLRAALFEIKGELCLEEHDLCAKNALNQDDKLGDIDK